MVRKEFIATLVLMIVAVSMAINLLSLVPIKAGGTCNAAAVAEFKTVFDLTTMRTKTGVTVSYNNIINSATKWKSIYVNNLLGWYLKNDYETCWIVTANKAQHCHYYEFEHKLCILGVCLITDQTVSYDNSIVVEVNNGGTSIYATGTRSYIEFSGAC